MCNNRECANYLKKNSVYNKCMEGFRKKWESYGKVTGSITLKKTSEDERRALGGIVGKNFMDETIKISFQEFEQGLQKTRFAPIDMKMVLEYYFGNVVYTHQEKSVQAQIEKDEFFDAIFANFADYMARESIVFRWLIELENQKKYGYQLMIKEFTKNSKEAKLLAYNVGRALNRLEEEEREEKQLAVFSAEISGNPHYFDRGTTAAQLLTHAICYWKNLEVPQSAYEWRECMQEVGLVSDNIASMVHAYGVQVEMIDGLHPAYEVFCQRKEPYVLTMENLKSIVGVKSINNKVFVVENEMVFMHLVENIKSQNVTLLCTSGQLRVAAFKLLTYLIESGAVIYYSGDLDPEGMDIADRLWQKYGDVIYLWRMNIPDYEKSISNEKLSDRSLVKLERLKNPMLRRTAENIRRERRAGYQENLLEDLLRDILSF